MWLPTPIYERLPQFWLLLGLLFMSSGTYLGFDYELSFVYFGVGAICVVWSIAVVVKRSRYRNDSSRRSIPVFKSDAELAADAARDAAREKDAAVARENEKTEPPLGQAN